VPVETLVDPKLGIAIQRLTGEVRGEQVVAAQRRVFEDPRNDPAIPVLWDARAAITTTVAFDEMRDMVAKAEPLYPRMGPGRSAILVSRAADFGMGRMYQALSAGTPRTVQVFDDHDEAMAWLLGSSS